MGFRGVWGALARLLTILVAPASLAACGAGVAGVVAASQGSGGGNAAPVLTAFEVVTPKVSRTPLRLVASRPMRAPPFLAAQDDQGQRALTNLDGLPGNEVNLPAGETVLDWDFAPQLGPGFTPRVQLFARRPGGATIDGGEIALGLGNDPPVL